MSDPGVLLRQVDEERLGAWLRERRWFGSKAAGVAEFGVLDVVALTSQPPALACALVEARLPSGVRDLYQLLVGHDGEGAGEVPADAVIDDEVYDALASPVDAAVLVELMRESATLGADEGTIGFHWTGAVPPPSGDPAVRPMGVEQSNSTIVIDDALALKVFRRLEPGENPELEMLRFLTPRGFENVASLAGWYSISGGRIEATLGVLQRFVADGRDGWKFALEEPGGFLERARELGETTGRMHAVLASDPSDRSFAPEEATEAALAREVEAVDEEIERAFREVREDDERVAAIAGRADDVRARLRELAAGSGGGRLIRHHGDYHLGQTLVTPDRWVILDFEGEPARSLEERRRKRSPLRDVAGMLRSFAYAAAASELLHGRPAPEGWEQEARRRYLEGYMAGVDRSLLPEAGAGIENLLSIYELEKAVYELRYELNNRPDWVGIPVAAIARLLD